MGLVLVYGVCFGQENNREKEAIETLNWINSKLTQYQYESIEANVIQTCVFIKVEKLATDYYLVGAREQKTSDPWAFKLEFKIPISKINSITFLEKKDNYWVEIKLKNNEKAIINYTEKKFNDDTDRIQFMLSKNIDSENLQPRIIKAFHHLFSLYGNIKVEKF